MKIRTQTKAGGIGINHNQAKTVKRRTGVKAGGLGAQHNQAKAKKRKTGIKAGGIGPNHNQAKTLKRKTSLQAGGGPSGTTGTNHNQVKKLSLSRETLQTLKISVKAGGWSNHNQAKAPKRKTRVKAGGSVMLE
jgi:hypothetical protein